MDGRRDRQAVAAAYADARARLQDEARALDLSDARLAWVRLTLAGLATAVAIGALATARWSVGWAGVPAVAFAAVAVVHARSLAARTAARRRLACVEQGIARIEHRWQGQGTGGESHRSTEHPYAEDLDLFGRASLFELLCTARTDTGERTLARWLLAPASPEVVVERQAAVAELAARPQLREDLSVLGPDLPRAATTAAVAAWAGAPTSAPAWWSRVALVSLSAATLSGIAWWWRTGEPALWLGGALAAQAVVGWRLRPRILSAIRHVEETAHDLSLAATLIERLEREAFEGPGLRALRQRLEGGGIPASEAIDRLARLAELLASRRNQFFGPLALLLFWATHLAWAIDGWRARHGTHVAAWFDVIGEVEALAALATFAAERPAAVFPTLEPGPPRLVAHEMTHPLLNPDHAVGNDVALGGEHPHLLVVSGSNMSGKSTYLRAIGVNVVLAQAGAPVTARAMALTPMTPAGTMRVQDSLESGRSRFFAEISKLRQIVDLARLDGPGGTLFLIDELLAGTNSHDRQLGAAGVLRGLVGLGAIGLATTHDLALTALVDDASTRAANVHFEDRFEGGTLVFDYRLRPGVVGTSNALVLMRSVGLDV
ncbi:MAG: hypothetical protein R2745_15670 [Vicinamibacterales bacterium]